MATSRIEGDVFVNGNLSCTTFTPPDASVGNAAVAAGANIAASKLEHRHSPAHAQASGSDVATKSEVIHIVRGATGTLVAFEVAIDTAPTGGDKQFTVDLQVSTGGGAFATVLSSVVTVNQTDADRTISNATLASTALVDGDALKVVVTASGSTGSQGQGVRATAWLDEDPS